MAYIYYKNPNWIKNNYMNFSAAPLLHKHNINDISKLKLINGGVDSSDNFQNFTGLITTTTTTDNNIVIKEPISIDSTLTGIYYNNETNPSNILFGNPSWEEGCVPGVNEQERLENMQRSVPLNSTIYIPYMSTYGTLDDKWNFWAPLKINCIIPEGTESIDFCSKKINEDISKNIPKYALRYNKYYLFVNLNNQSAAHYNGDSTSQPIIVNEKNVWEIHWNRYGNTSTSNTDENNWWYNWKYNRYNGTLMLRSKTAQFLTNEDPSKLNAPSNLASSLVQHLTGILDLYDITITFNGSKKTQEQET